MPKPDAGMGTRRPPSGDREEGWREDFSFTVPEFQRRLRSVHEVMRSRELSIVLIFDPASIYYLSGMNTENFFRLQCLIVVEGAEPTLVLPDVELGRHHASSWVSDVEVCSSFDDPVLVVAGVVGKRAAQASRIGVDIQSAFVDAELGERLARALSPAEIVDSFGIVEPIRLVKSEAELAYMQEAAALTDKGIQAATEAARVGAQDHEIGSAMTSAMYGAGSGPLYWGPIVAAGYRSGLAHSTFAGYKLQQGDTVFLELTAQVKRYVAPRMRTLVLDATPEDPDPVEASVQECLDVLRRTARHGQPASDVASKALEVLQPHLSEWEFHHYFGYPVGIFSPGSWVENLGYFIRVDNPRPLQAGMTFHLPIILRRYGVRAVAGSSTFVIEDDGARPLSSLPTTLRYIAG